MSEPKRCPMHFDPFAGNFVPCCQEECEWWVYVPSLSEPYDPKFIEVTDVGHCAILDIGRTP